MPQKLILFSLLIALLAVPIVSFGQDQKLAQQYFADGDYERAMVLFKKLVETTQGNTYFMERYVGRTGFCQRIKKENFRSYF